MKKRLIMILLALGCSCCIGLSGCTGNVSEPDTREEQDEDEDADKDEDDEDDEKENEDEPSEIRITELDYSSPDSILEFVSGDWKFVNLTTGVEYASLRIKDNGECNLGRFDNARICSGTILFDEYLDDDLPGVHRYEITLNGLNEAYGCPEDTGTSCGRFMIAQTAGYDYLYLEEIGNGGSILAYEVFPEAVEDYNLMMKWCLVRENNVTHEEKLQPNAKFYAQVIQNTDEGLIVQRLDEVSFVTYQEYTNFKILAAYFDESNNQQACLCTINEDADTSGVLDLSELDNAYPSTVYTIYTDSEGNIEEMHDVEDAYYGRYEINSLEQEISFGLNTFTINGWEHDPADYGIDGNAILDLEVFGEDLIITSHLDPHMGVYTIFDMRNNWPEHEIYGANFIHGDVIWDSFYSYMDTVYDYEDHVIYTVDGAEIFDLSFSDDGSQIIIKYWKEDYEKEYEEIIDRPACVNAPHYAYADYARHRTAENWNKFISYAPDDALFMVMVNPHSDDAWDFHMPSSVDDGLDMVYVIALQNDVSVSLGNFTDIVLDKGQIECFNVTVPEGAPMYTLHAETPDGQTAEWDVTWISGQDDTRWIFK